VKIAKRNVGQIKALGPYLIVFALLSPIAIPAFMVIPVYLLSSSPHHLSYAYQYPAAIAPFLLYSFVDWHHKTNRNVILYTVVALGIAPNLVFSPSIMGRLFWSVPSTYNVQAYSHKPSPELPESVLNIPDAHYIIQNTVCLPRF